MKRILVLLPIFLFTTICLYAHQYNSEEQKVFEGGIILGVNFSNVDDQDNFVSYHKVSLNLGGIVNVHFSKKWSVSMELLYSRKGDKEVNVTSSLALSTYISTYNLTLDYAEVPIMLHYNEGKMNYEAGISYARLFSSSEIISQDPPVVVDPILNAFNTEDYEIIFGISRKLNKNIMANLRWEGSLAQIRPWYRLPLNYNFDGQLNNVINLRLIYFI